MFTLHSHTQQTKISTFSAQLLNRPPITEQRQRDHPGPLSLLPDLSLNFLEHRNKSCTTICTNNHRVPLQIILSKMTNRNLALSKATRKVISKTYMKSTRQTVANYRPALSNATNKAISVNPYEKFSTKGDQSQTSTQQPENLHKQHLQRDRLIIASRRIAALQSKRRIHTKSATSCDNRSTHYCAFLNYHDDKPFSFSSLHLCKTRQQQPILKCMWRAMNSRLVFVLVANHLALKEDCNACK